MKRHFQVLIEGTVQSNPDFKGREEEQLEEMREAVQLSFKPDVQWGVDHISTDVVLVEPEEGDSDT